MTRSTKRSIPPASRAPRATQRGVVAQGDDPEPFFSSRPTRKDIGVPDEPAAAPSKKEVGPRGQYSIAAARGIATDSISGTIDVVGRKRRRTTKSPIDEIHLVSSTKKEITVVIQGRSVTLGRQPAIQLASLIFTTFGVSSD